MNLLVDVLASNPAIVMAAISRFQREGREPDLFGCQSGSNNRHQAA
jgi:hypothetical protein